MANFYCTCLSDRNTKRQSLREHKKLHPTTVDKDDCCVHCGYYAIARPSPQHNRYPRPDYKKWNTEPTKSRVEWSKLGLLNEYYLYFHGHEEIKQGLSDGRLRKDQEEIRNAREEELRRVNGNRG